ncbi:laccase-4-like isoform X1 [Colias croceus]|uniref:laccase-4-like isoform X1 n=1 Tax=Colias crocea TaxID=72248 RepID=UPI001E27D5D8|nr:laccase-4-like isoform X1 [Colias croceus]XP_045506940.1 laccase-4-like isoform X2 [Colias croceus]XP_045506941.1 laccase-4-like isoform X1 [Colias croceus]XP_045506942.1 laccase-4-like isoform X1 [Colias croceus]
MCHILAKSVLFLALAVSIYAKGVVVQSPIETTTDIVIETTLNDQIVKDSARNTDTKENDTKQITAEESPDIKVLDDNTPKVLESASKVLYPIVSNESFNDLKYQVRRRNTSTVAAPKVQYNEPKKTIPTARHMVKKNEFRAHVQYDEVTGELISGEHPCLRECKEGEEPMICYYHFNLEWYQTMSKACYDCPYNETDCDRIDCIPADGMSRPLTVVNRKMPGPAIEVCQHDRIIVDVENDLMTEGTTVHWHGQHQRGTPYMDGTPYITQCPIMPETTFRYQFNASEAGTHFWHSHSGMQRADGAAGAFVIRKPKSQDPHRDLYDYDRSDHVMLITDWIHELSVGMFTDHHHSLGDNKPPTLLINGVGRFRYFNDTNKAAKPMYMKTARFNVEQGYKYRFRVINAEFLNCPIEMSVDGHNITILSSDGYDLEPITATSLVTYAGERFDFVVEANNEIDNYWIRFRGLMDCDERFTKAKQVAVLHYEGAMEVEPAGDPTWEELHNEGLQLNALNKGEEDDETISVAEMKSLKGYDDSLKEVADYQFYVAYDFYPKNNSHFHRSPYYGYYQVPEPDNRLYTPQLNHISMKMPSSPLLVSRPSSDNFCNSSSIAESCKEGFCECSHVLSVKRNAVVEVIIVDEGVTFDANHPFHLHGHYFRVVGMRRLASEITVDEIKAYDAAGLMKRNLKNAPLKDTVTVPDGGYTIIRFKADNPGYWLFHCHIEFHVEVGMALVFKVGEEKDFVPVPRDFPTCGSYMPDNMLEHETTPKPSDNQYISITHWWPVVYLNNTNSSAVQITSPAFVVLYIWLIRILIT